jgi:hypothetical protein
MPLTFHHRTSWNDAVGRHSLHVPHMPMLGLIRILSRKLKLLLSELSLLQREVGTASVNVNRIASVNVTIRNVIFPFQPNLLS